MDRENANLLDEVLEANRAFLAGSPVPRPTTLGDRNLLVLTCVDPRLTALLPRAMGVAAEEMYQVRNAGNSVRAGDSDSVRSLCALLVLGQADEVFVVGHTDCRMCAATAMSLLDGMAKRGMSRDVLGGADVRESFGGIASERSNALGAAREIRKSALLPPGIPVHALLADVVTGKLEILENGYRVVPPGPKRSTPTRSSIEFRRAPSGLSRPPGPVVPPERFDTLPKPPEPLTLDPVPDVEPSNYHSGPVAPEAKPPAEEPRVGIQPERSAEPVAEPEPGPAKASPRSPRPAQQEAAARGFVPPKPPPVPPPAPRPAPEPESEKPRHTRPARRPAKQKDEPTSPFERAEDVLKRLMERRRK